MSATIFTGWHLLTYGTATNIIFVGAAVLVLRSKVRESRDYMAAGDAAYAQAEQRDAAFEETRNKPWYWPTGPAIEADKPHDAEVLHVAYPTQELRLVADDPQVAVGLAALADEVGLVQALSPNACPECRLLSAHKPLCSRPVSLPWEQPSAALANAYALSDRPAADEDEVGDEQPGEAVSSVPSRLGGWWREQRVRFRELFRFRSSAPVNPPYRGRHWVSDVQHTGAWPLVVPKQRTEGE